MLCQTCQLKRTKRGRKECTNCRQKKWRKKHPFKYHYRNKRNKAKQRNIEFDLTLEQFKEIWLRDPEKWKDKRDNPSRTEWQLDRKDGDKGYTYQNCHVITRAQNLNKYLNNNDKWEEPIEENNLPDIAPF